jgi:hypothetical protein
MKHAGDHQAVVQKAELHVLAANCRTGIVLLAMAPNLFEHLRVDFKMAIVQVVVEFAVRADAGECPAIQEATLPQPAQAPMSDILIASDEAYDLGSRRESVPQEG